MKIYVAGKFQARNDVQIVMGLIRKLGHEITYDWTIQDDTDDPDILEACAKCDIQGVSSCDVLVVVAAHGTDYRGVHSELGAAIALGKPVMLWGTGIDRNVFTKHPLVQRYHTLSELLGELR